MIEVVVSLLGMILAIADITLAEAKRSEIQGLLEKLKKRLDEHKPAQVLADVIGEVGIQMVSIFDKKAFGKTRLRLCLRVTWLSSFLALFVAIHTYTRSYGTELSFVMEVIWSVVLATYLCLPAALGFWLAILSSCAVVAKGRLVPMTEARQGKKKQEVTSDPIPLRPLVKRLCLLGATCVVVFALMLHLPYIPSWALSRFIDIGILEYDQWSWNGLLRLVEVVGPDEREIIWQAIMLLGILAMFPAVFAGTLVIGLIYADAFPRLITRIMLAGMQPLIGSPQGVVTAFVTLVALLRSELLK